MKLFKKSAKKSTLISKKELEDTYSEYFISGERYERGFKVPNHTLVLTNIRLLEYRKTDPERDSLYVESIPLENICDIKCTTSCFGKESSDIAITYISSESEDNNMAEYRKKLFQFPRGFCVTPLWVKLETAAHHNKHRITALR